MPTYFISGHLDLTDEEFAAHYAEPIYSAARENARFVVGDARGTDKRAQDFLWSLRAEHPDLQVTVYHMFDSPRNNPGFPTVGGFLSDSARDQAMTEASNFDIAWVRPGRENSGTARNLQRRTR